MHRNERTSQFYWFLNETKKNPTHQKCYSEVYSISHSVCHIEIEIISSYEIQILLVVERDMTGSI